MGVSVTTNLQLIKPDLDESIKENLPTFPGWADQNADNMDQIDGLFRDDSNPAFYVPVWTAGATPVVLGAGGFVSGKVIRLFPSMVVVNFRIFTGGAGFVPGAGTYRISLPTGYTTIASEFTTFFESSPFGRSILMDNDNVATSSNMSVHYDLSLGTVHFRGAAGALWNPTSPITLAQNDRVSGFLIYPTENP